MNGLVHIGDAINRSLEKAEFDQIAFGGIPSGFPSLDRLTRGWNPGELVIIGGRPCVGMTALALGMARNAAVDFGIPTVYYSLELSTVTLTDRLIVSEADIPVGKLHGKDRVRMVEPMDFYGIGLNHLEERRQERTSGADTRHGSNSGG